ncbi:ROK family protein [Nocardioides campestrisoli]|uniref:ROK family protein n=1 Tax=Nocardioides campestrisoli TaxID=2736757 RepID=UPI00163D7FEC|nr:ROK family protein [Nocardioides campestrisoli]
MAQQSSTIVVSRGRFGSPAGRVLEQVRGRGLATRDELAGPTCLSARTVARTVASLLEGGLLRERPDRARAGSIGRPGTPVEIDPTLYVTVGVHVGTRLLTVAVGDPSGRVVDSRTTDKLPADPLDLDWVGSRLVEMLRTLPGRRPLVAGMVAPWRDIGLDQHATGAALREALGLEVTTSEHIAAVAAAEYIHRRHGTAGITTYLYVRNTTGFAVARESGGEAEVSRAARLTHFPTRADVPCSCGRTGCLEASTSDHAVAVRAHAAGLVDEPVVEALYEAAGAGVPAARELLVERARLLGETAALVRDMIDPDRMILVGQAFTDFPGVLDEVVAAFAGTTTLPPLDLSFTRFGAGIQALAACTVALAPVYDDPFAVLPTPFRPAHSHAL